MATTFRYTEESRVVNEADYFAQDGLTDEELEQYSRRTSKRPGLCLAGLLASPFAAELLCRIVDRLLR